jgi:hypothetical protein
MVAGQAFMTMVAMLGSPTVWLTKCSSIHALGKSRDLGVGWLAGGVVVYEHFAVANEVGVKVGHNEVVGWLVAAGENVADRNGSVSTVKDHARC